MAQLLRRSLDSVHELHMFCRQCYSEEKATTDSSRSVRFPFNTLLPGEPTLDDQLLKEMKEGVKVQTGTSYSGRCCSLYGFGP